MPQKDKFDASFEDLVFSQSAQTNQRIRLGQNAKILGEITKFIGFCRVFVSASQFSAFQLQHIHPAPYGYTKFAHYYLIH
jgi:hypothetical protein